MLSKVLKIELDVLPILYDILLSSDIIRVEFLECFNEISLRVYKNLA